MRTLAVFFLCAFSLAVHAQAKPYRIGYIQLATAEEQASLTAAFHEGLRELGYVKGRDFTLEERLASGRPERLPELAADLVRLKVDVIVTGANPAIAAAKGATSSIPVVMTTSRDPIGSGFIASLSRPGGNITGISSDPGFEVQSKRLELLKEALPKVVRVGLLWNPAPPGAAKYREVVEAAARTLGMRLHALEVRERGELESAFAAIARERAEAVIVLPDPLFFTARRQVVELSQRHRLPGVFHAKEFVELGGFMSYGSSLSYQFRRAAVYVDKILKGARPADLPVEQATKLDLVINLKTAAALGAAVPQSLLVRADEVIE